MRTSGLVAGILIPLLLSLLLLSLVGLSLAALEKEIEVQFTQIGLQNCDGCVCLESINFYIFTVCSKKKNKNKTKSKKVTLFSLCTDILLSLHLRVCVWFSVCIWLLHSGDGIFGGAGEFYIKWKPEGQYPDVCYTLVADDSATLNVLESWKYRVCIVAVVFSCCKQIPAQRLTLSILLYCTILLLVICPHQHHTTTTTTRCPIQRPRRRSSRSIGRRTTASRLVSSQICLMNGARRSAPGVRTSTRLPLDNGSRRALQLAPWAATARRPSNTNSSGLLSAYVSSILI